MSQEADNMKVPLKTLKTCRCPYCRDRGAGRGWRVGRCQLVQGSRMLCRWKAKGGAEVRAGSSACLGNGDPPGNGTGELGKPHKGKWGLWSEDRGELCILFVCCYYLGFLICF